MKVLQGSTVGPFQALLYQAVAATDATKAALYRLDSDSAGVIHVDSLVLDGEPFSGWIPSETGLIDLSLTGGTIIVSADSLTDDRVAYPLLANLIGRSIACVPMRAQCGPGVLLLGHPDPDHFKDAHVEWLRCFSRHVEAQLCRSGYWDDSKRSVVRDVFPVARQVLDSERRQREINDELHGVAQQITAAETLEDALAAVVTSVMRVFGAASASIYLLNENGQLGPERYTTRHTGLPHWDDHVRVRPQGITMTVIRTGQSIVIEDTANDPRTRELQNSDQRTVAVIPLRHGGKQVGVLYADWSEQRSLTGSDVGLFETLASYGAISIANARLREHERQARQMAEAEHEQLQRFLETVAHDLRGPLTLLVAYSELIRQGSIADRYEATERAVPGLENAAQRVQRLVNDLIDLSRINSGRFDVQPSSVDLAAVAQEVAEKVQATTDIHEIEVQGPDQLVGQWDPARIRELLTNLVTNAVHYAPDGGQVQITLTKEGDDVLIAIADDGIGIAREHFDRVFRPFSRVESLPTTKERGLGLYIAKAIVDAHRGRIWFDSEVDVGSTFYVCLPTREQTLASA